MPAKTALITGAGGGVGSAIADALAAAYELLLGGRPSDRLDQLAARLNGTVWPLDLSDTESLGISAPLPERLDLLIHNAGVAFPDHFAESSVDDWRTTMQVNVIGAVAFPQCGIEPVSETTATARKREDEQPRSRRNPSCCHVKCAPPSSIRGPPDQRARRQRHHPDCSAKCLNQIR